MTERTWKDNKETVFIPFRQIWYKSFQGEFEEFDKWFYPTSIHQIISICIVDSYNHRETLSNSLVFRRFLGLRRSLQWCIFSAHSGVYEAIARELRFVLEDLAQALYLDQQLGDSGLVSKTRTISILEDARLRGSQLI